MVGDRKLSKKMYGNIWMINNIDRENWIILNNKNLQVAKEIDIFGKLTSTQILVSVYEKLAD